MPTSVRSHARAARSWLMRLGNSDAAHRYCHASMIMLAGNSVASTHARGSCSGLLSPDT